MLHRHMPYVSCIHMFTDMNLPELTDGWWQNQKSFNNEMTPEQSKGTRKPQFLPITVCEPKLLRRGFLYLGRK